MRGVVLRVGFAAIAAVSLAACAARDPIVSSADTNISGNWRVERQTDRITGAPMSSAYLTTRTSSHSGQTFPQPATFAISCFKEHPIARFLFLFKIGSTRNSELAYRFDEKPGQTVPARFVDGYTSVVIEDPAAVSRFMSELAVSKLLYLRIVSLNGGRTSAEFQVNGAAGAVEQALAGCRPKQRSASRD